MRCCSFMRMSVSASPFCAVRNWEQFAQLNLSIIQTLSSFKLGFDFLNHITENLKEVQFSLSISQSRINKPQVFSSQQSLALKYGYAKSTIGWFLMVLRWMRKKTSCFYSVHVIILVIHCNLFVLGVKLFNRPLLFVILKWYSIPVLIWTDIIKNICKICRFH